MVPFISAVRSLGYCAVHPLVFCVVRILVYYVVSFLGYCVERILVFAAEMALLASTGGNNVPKPEIELNWDSGVLQVTFTYGSRHVDDGLVQLSDSRYGFITFATRQTLPASKSSFIETFLCL